MLQRGVLVLLLAGAVDGASEPDRSWQNLGSVVKESDYTVVTRDGRCVSGRIESWDQNSVTVKSVPVDRVDVLRVGDSPADRDTIYSGRSAWSDLKEAEPNKYEHLRLDLKNGKQRTCRALVEAGGRLTCDEVPVEKQDVVRGYYVRLAPATEWEHHAARENVLLLAPRTWFNFALFPRITVLLYDVGRAQDDSRVECRASR